MPHAAAGNRGGFPIATIASLPSQAFVPADPGLLERPPKLVMSI
jgi:hypothetical protein